MNSISANRCPKLSLRGGVLVSPSNCRSSNQAYGSTCSFSCARGQRLSGPSSTQCGKGGVWNQRANTVRCEGEKLLMTCCAIKILQFANKVCESWLEKIVTTLKAYSNIFFYSFNPRTYTQIRTPTVVQGARGGGIDGKMRTRNKQTATENCRCWCFVVYKKKKIIIIMQKTLKGRGAEVATTTSRMSEG